jgi:hypothetical protein
MAAVAPPHLMDPVARIPAEVDRAAGNREIAPSVETSMHGIRDIELPDQRESLTGVAAGEGGASPSARQRAFHVEHPGDGGKNPGCRCST